MKKHYLPMIGLLFITGIPMISNTAYARNERGATKDLEDFGDKLKNESQAGGLSQDSEDIIKDIYLTNNPNLKMLDANAVSAVGVSSDKDNRKIIVQDSLTGAVIDSCAKLDGFGQIVKQGNKCAVNEIVNPSMALRNALVASSAPIQGKLKVIKNNQEQEVDATFEVIVKSQYDGSYCETTVANGVFYQTCYSRPRR